MAYQLSSALQGQALLSAFNFFDGSDPSHGYVSYQNQHNAQAMGLYSVNEATNSVRLGVDSKNVYPLGSQGRPSLRLESKQAFEHGLFIADFAHMPPSTCGLWPAFWAFGHDWPNNGEVDIIEGVNTNTQNIISAHTRDGCSLSPSLAHGFTASVRTSSCGVGSDNVGCGIDPPSSDASSYGTGFNAAGGGVYAMQWESDFISIWHFARDDIPDDIDRKKPNPSEWGLPQAIFGGPSCDVDSFFSNMNLVININFCGDYGGSAWGHSDSCGALAPTCNEYVANNPHAFADAYWDVNYIDIYQLGAKEVVDPWPFGSSSIGLPLQSSTSWPFASHSSAASGAGGSISSSSSSMKAMMPTKAEATSPVTAAVQVPSTSAAASMSMATSSRVAAGMTSLAPSSSSTRASSTASVVSHSTSSLSRLAAVVNASSSSSAMTSSRSSSSSSSSSSRRTSLDSRTSTAPLSTILPVKMPELTSSMLNVSQATGTRMMPATPAPSSASLPSSPSSSSISSSATSSAMSSMTSKSTSAKVALPTNLDPVIPTTAVSPSSHAAPPSTAERIPAQSAEPKVSTAEHLMQWNATTFATATVTTSKAFTTTHVVMISPLPSTRSVESVTHTVSSIMTVVEHQVETDSVIVTETETETQSLAETWTWEHDAATTPAAASTSSQAAAASSPQVPIDWVAEPAETAVLVETARPVDPVAVAAPSPLSQTTPSPPAPTRFHYIAGHNITINAAFVNGTGQPSRPKTAFTPVPPPLAFVANAPMAKVPMESLPQPSQLSLESAAPGAFGRTMKSAVLAGLMALAVMMVANA